MSFRLALRPASKAFLRTTPRFTSLNRTTPCAFFQTAKPTTATATATTTANPTITPGATCPNPASSPPENNIKADKVHGSYHWDFERAVSAALIPLCGASAAYGAHPVTDVLLGVVIPLHSHIGFDACITDYVHSRKFPVLNKVCVWALRAGTGLVLYGCYQFNINDVGMTEGIKRIWKA